MISQIKTFLRPDKQGIPEESRRIERPKRCVKTKNNKDEDKGPKKETQDILVFIYFYLKKKMTGDFMFEGGLKSSFDNFISSAEFLTNGIQALEHRWKKYVDPQGVLF